MMFTNLSPCFPLSLQGEGEELRRGFAPSNYP